MRVIGLTGGIASGKSKVSSLLKEMGAVIIDADLVAREVVEPRQPAWHRIVEVFGRDILKGDGSIDRPKLGEIVFNSPTSRQQLNQITHPEITRLIDERVDGYRLAGEKLVVIDAPLLLEVGLDRRVDQVWLVYVDRETQITRLMNRDNLYREQAEARIDSQMPLDEKMKRAHVIIDNRGDFAETRKQVLQLMEGI